MTDQRSHQTPAFTVETCEGVRFLRCQPMREAAPQITHAFTMRGLELRVRGAIGPDRVAADERRLLSALGLGDRPLVKLRQVHGRDVFVLDRGDRRRPGAPTADAIVSRAPGVAIAVAVADCVPILMADGAGRAIAAVHAGWRGTIQGVARGTVEALARLEVDPARLIVAIGPSAGPCCYEVGPEVVERLRSARVSDECFVPTSDGHARLDLWKANVVQINQAGVREESIHVAGLCTVCRPDLFYSYRREGEATGRMLGIVAR